MADATEKWDVIPNPAKKDSTDPAFLVREVSGFPVALCWSRDKADRIAADHNAKLAALSRPPCNPQEPPIGWESPR